MSNRHLLTLLCLRLSGVGHPKAAVAAPGHPPSLPAADAMSCDKDTSSCVGARRGANQAQPGHLGRVLGGVPAVAAMFFFRDPLAAAGAGLQGGRVSPGERGCTRTCMAKPGLPGGTGHPRSVGRRRGPAGLPSAHTTRQVLSARGPHVANLCGAQLAEHRCRCTPNIGTNYL